MRKSRFVRPNGGFLLIDALIAAAIIFSGVAALLNLMPTLMEMSERQRLVTESADYAIAKQQDLYTEDYSSINTASQQTGDFNTLIGTAATGINLYTWKYNATEELPGVMKKVNLKVSRSIGTKTVETDTWTFYVVDMANQTP